MLSVKHHDGSNVLTASWHFLLPVSWAAVSPIASNFCFTAGGIIPSPLSAIVRRLGVRFATTEEAPNDKAKGQYLKASIFRSSVVNRGSSNDIDCCAV